MCPDVQEGQWPCTSEGISSWKKHQTQEQAAQGSGEVPNAGGTKEMWGHGIEMYGQGLVMGLGWSGRLLIKVDLMILKVFASLNDSRIPYFGNSVTLQWYH